MKLMDQVRETLLVQRYAYATEESGLFACISFAIPAPWARKRPGSGARPDHHSRWQGRYTVM